jgi:hypothetical protein
MANINIRLHLCVNLSQRCSPQRAWFQRKLASKSCSPTSFAFHIIVVPW